MRNGKQDKQDVLKQFVANMLEKFVFFFVSEFSRHPEGLSFFWSAVKSVRDLHFQDTMLEMPLVAVNEELVILGCDQK